MKAIGMKGGGVYGRPTSVAVTLQESRVFQEGIGRVKDTEKSAGTRMKAGNGEE